MKKATILLLSVLFINSVYSQEKEQEVKSEIKSVTIFYKGAQVNRKAKIEISSGKSVIKLIKLSPFINESTPKSKKATACPEYREMHSLPRFFGEFTNLTIVVYSAGCKFNKCLIS